MLGNGTVGGEKALSVAGGLEPLHAPFTLTRRQMRVLTPIVEIAALAVLDPGQNFALGCPVAGAVNDHGDGPLGCTLRRLMATVALRLDSVV